MLKFNRRYNKKIRKTQIGIVPHSDNETIYNDDILDIPQDEPKLQMQLDNEVVNTVNIRDGDETMDAEKEVILDKEEFDKKYTNDIMKLNYCLR